MTLPYHYVPFGFCRCIVAPLAQCMCTVQSTSKYLYVQWHQNIFLLLAGQRVGMRYMAAPPLTINRAQTSNNNCNSSSSGGGAGGCSSSRCHLSTARRSQRPRPALRAIVTGCPPKLYCRNVGVEGPRMGADFRVPCCGCSKSYWAQTAATQVPCPPPLEIPPSPLAICPHPPLGGETVTSLFCQAISIAVVCVPHLSHTRSCIAFPLLRISHLCVFCDVLSPKAVYRVLCPPKASPKPAPKQAGWVAQAGAKSAAKPAPCTSASSSSAGATHPVPVMQTEHVQQFKMCYSRTYCLPFLWTPNNIVVP